MNVVNQCMGLLQSEIAPLYIKELKENEAMVNWVRAFRDCTNNNITGFERISENMDVCIPANSVSVVNVIGPTQKLPSERPIIVEPLTNDTDFIVVNSLSESNRHTYPARIANLKNTDIWLKRNRKIGFIREVNVLPEINNEIEFFSTETDAETIVYKQEKIIKDSVSPYAAPIVIVRKKDQSIRLCVDYRKLNIKTVRDVFPLPRIDESLDALNGAKFFSTLDMASGFHQIAMDPVDQHKTAFSTPFGLFEYTRMPMGLQSL
ncbi:unnamed protein product [Mytilus coruscus]|uniref:Reverse transcriptase domain-containing protein n=1 Tax=Mytilus coruscus TaxID=42192 RepID=A0A6J8F014_MYTCO|nr:unnamed protein product [Mytilus coruscus]